MRPQKGIGDLAGWIEYIGVMIAIWACIFSWLLHLGHAGSLG